MRINREKSWDSLAQVVKRADSPRSYIFQDEVGKILRRDRRDLLHTNEEFTVESPNDSGDDGLEFIKSPSQSTQSTATVQAPSSNFSTGTQTSPYIKQDLVGLSDSLPGSRHININYGSTIMINGLKLILPGLRTILLILII